MKAQKPLAKATAIAERFRALDRAAVGGKKRGLFAAKDGKTCDLYIYESIGMDWWTGGGITANSIKQALEGELAGAAVLNIYINCEGGDVFEAKAIYTQLKRFSAEKVMHIDGIAASAATLIAMAGDKIITAPVATWMVHEAWTIAMGPAADLRKTADLLDLENNTIAETYAKQTGGTVDEMRALMTAETWMNAQQALDAGFTDEISADDSEADVAAHVEPTTNLERLAALTQERIKGVTTASLLAARAEQRRRDHPGRPGEQRPPAGR